MAMPDERAELASRFAHYSKYRQQFTKAVDVAFGGNVKQHLFLPSRRSIYSVVGRNGDEFIDPERPFCSCESYYFGVLAGKSRYCYHILGYKIASEAGLIDTVRFSDDEWDSFAQAFLSDITQSRGSD